MTRRFLDSLPTHTLLLCAMVIAAGWLASLALKAPLQFTLSSEGGPDRWVSLHRGRIIYAVDDGWPDSNDPQGGEDGRTILDGHSLGRDVGRGLSGDRDSPADVCSLVAGAALAAGAGRCALAGCSCRAARPTQAHCCTSRRLCPLHSLRP